MLQVYSRINYPIPTGYLFVDDYSKGQLETLSIGDYGKHYNVKADFLGFNEPLNGVPNTYCMPLSEKWVITVSTQYGCRMKCNFCLSGDTLISTPNGPIPIKEIKEGDVVYGRNEAGVKHKQIVTKIYKNKPTETVLNISWDEGSLLITGNHEIRTYQYGWKTAYDVRNMVDKGKRIVLVGDGSLVVIKNITEYKLDDYVYNFECTPNHTYYANNILVHNCDVPNVPWKGNVPFQDLKQQFYNAIRLFPQVKYTERLNLHYARMGDPIFNYDVFEFSRWLHSNKRQIKQDTGLSIEVIHPVLTTSLPKNFSKLKGRILEWCDIKNNIYNGQAGLQFSINSTNEKQREEMFGGLSLPLKEFAKIADGMPMPVSRKYCLNFAYSTDFEIDAALVRRLFSPDKFMCKITPIHNNNACRENGIKTEDGYESYRPYEKPENDLKNEGFDVLVFVPSIDEEEGLVTCGNAVLGGSKLQSDDVIKIKGL